MNKLGCYSSSFSWYYNFIGSNIWSSACHMGRRWTDMVGPSQLTMTPAAFQKTTPMLDLEEKQYSLYFFIIIINFFITFDRSFYSKNLKNIIYLVIIYFIIK
jgi:hypothetical protein